MTHKDFETTTIYLAEYEHPFVARDVTFSLSEHTVQVILDDTSSRDFACILPETVSKTSRPYQGNILTSGILDKEIPLEDPEYGDIHDVYYSKDKNKALSWLKHKRDTLLHNTEIEYRRATKSEIKDFTETQTLKM